MYHGLLKHKCKTIKELGSLMCFLGMAFTKLLWVQIRVKEIKLCTYNIVYYS